MKRTKARAAAEEIAADLFRLPDSTQARRLVVEAPGNRWSGGGYSEVALANFVERGIRKLLAASKGKRK